MTQEQETFIQSPYLQTRQGIEAEMSYKPQFEGREHIGSNKLRNKVALITGGDSGIGRAIAIFIDSSYMSGQVLHVNGGEIVNG
jgi:hypothetical protein